MSAQQAVFTFVGYLKGLLEEKCEYNHFEKDLAHYTRALGHPARIAVLIEIAKKGFVVRGENIEVPQLSQATVLQHLRELKRAGLLQGRIFGAKADYKLDLDNLRKFDENFHTFMDHFKKP